MPSIHWSSLFSRRSPRSLLTLAFWLLGITLIADSAWAVRGRPIIANGTVRADNGEPLRGARWSQDNQPSIACSRGERAVPPFSALVDLKSRGLNTLHVYGEKFEDQMPAGYNACSLDWLVSRLKELDMYMILTIGNAPPGYDAAFVEDFWTFYGARYRNETHVLFEVQNEPFFSTGSFTPPDIRALQQNTHDLLRSCAAGDPCATDSPILFYSYPFLNDTNQVIADRNALSGVNWTKAAIAFHGYDDNDTTTPDPRTVAAQLLAAGISLIDTEAAVNGSDALDLVDLAFYEQAGLAWMSFQAIPLMDAKFDDPIDAAWIVWIADFGSWPATSAAPGGAAVSLSMPANNRWVSADLNVNLTNPPLVADRTQPFAYERFDVVTLSPTTVALRAQANSLYVTLDGSGYLRAVSQTPVEFEWLDRADGRVALRSLANRQFVSADFNLNNPPWLIANRKKGGGPWEGYILLVH